jgi:hypothetical protein
VLLKRWKGARLVAELDSFQVDLSVPGIGGVSGTWKPDDSERRAAWEMYVELVTRIAVVKLHPEEGLLREALSSLYSVFGSTRQILREHGPEVAKPKGGGDLSFGYLSVTVLQRFAVKLNRPAMGTLALA